MNRYKYLVMPGNAGHAYVSARELIRLYNVKQSECVVASMRDRFQGCLGISEGPWIVLKPKYDGSYDKMPEPIYLWLDRDHPNGYRELKAPVYQVKEEWDIKADLAADDLWRTAQS